MDYVKCSIFPNAWTPEPKAQEHFLDILQEIEDGTNKEVIEKIRSLKTKKAKDPWKKKLKCFTPCGVFNLRRLTDIATYNGIVVLDIDNLDYSKATFLKDRMRTDPYIHCVFISPSGNGLKVFMEVNNEDPKRHKIAFEVCKEYLEGNYSNIVSFEVDASGKDYTRLCFVSHDPEAHYNYSGETFEIDFEYLESIKYGFKKVRRETPNNSFQPIDCKKVFETMIKFVKKSKVGGFVKGNRNNFIYSLAHLCSDYGIPDDLAFEYVSNRYPSLGYEEIKATVKSAYRKGQQNFNTKRLGQPNNSQSTLI
jgi:hypothetical protein